MEVELTPSNRGHAGEAEMRSLMVVVPDEVVDRAAPSREGEERTDMQTFVVHGAKEALDFAIGLGRVRPQQMVSDPVGGTGLLEARPARGMKCVAHGEG